MKRKNNIDRLFQEQLPDFDSEQSMAQYSS